MSTLTEVRALLSDPERWTKQAEARDEHGTPVNAWDAEATCWCLYGALIRVTNTGMYANEEYNKACEQIRKELSAGYEHEWISEFNDHSSHSQVIEMLDSVISKENENEC